MKCNQTCPGFELLSMCPFPMTVTITPQAPPSTCLYVAVTKQKTAHHSKISIEAILFKCYNLENQAISSPISHWMIILLGLHYILLGYVSYACFSNVFLTGLRICWLYPMQRPSQKRGALGMTLNCIWCWGSSSGVPRSVEYSFITITSRSTLTWNGSNC